MSNVSSKPLPSYVESINNSTYNQCLHKLHTRTTIITVGSPQKNQSYIEWRRPDDDVTHTTIPLHLHGRRCRTSIRRNRASRLVSTLVLALRTLSKILTMNRRNLSYLMTEWKFLSMNMFAFKEIRQTPDFLFVRFESNAGHMKTI